MLIRQGLYWVLFGYNTVSINILIAAVNHFLCFYYFTSWDLNNILWTTDGIFSSMPRVLINLCDCMCFVDLLDHHILFVGIKSPHSKILKSCHALVLVNFYIAVQRDLVLVDNNNMSLFECDLYIMKVQIYCLDTLFQKWRG